MSEKAEYCSVKTVAQRLDCNASTVTDYANRGLLPRPRKIGGMVRWKWSEVEAVMDGIETEKDHDHMSSSQSVDPILARINGS